MVIFNRFLGSNLRTKLLIATLLTSILPLLLLGFFTYKYISGILQEDMSQHELENLQALNNQFDYLLTDIEQMSLFFYKNEGIKDILEKDPDRTAAEKYADDLAVQALFDTVKGVKEWDINLYILGENGDRYFSNNYLPAPYHLLRNNWGIFRKATAENGGLAWDTNYTISKLDTEDVALTAGRLIKHSETDEALGYILIDINESVFSSIYEKNNIQPNEELYVLDDQGYILSSLHNKEIVGSKWEGEGYTRITRGDNGFFNFKKDGKSQILTYYTADDPKLKLVSIKTLDAIKQKNNLIRKLTFNFALLGMIVSGWLAFYLAKTITMPLYKLMFLMGEVEKGNLDVRFEPKYKDDIGVFGRHFNKMLKRLKMLIQKNYERQIRLKDSEIKALRAQINPHFLYNTLDTVNWLARLHQADEISKIVVSLSEILKYSINKSDTIVSLEKDIDQLRNYLTIQEFRYRDTFDVELEIDPNVMKALIPPLLLQPLVENAIVHGLEAKVEKGTILVKIECRTDRLHILIRDDGIGMSDQEAAKLNHPLKSDVSDINIGIGIENVRKRLMLYYGSNHSWNLVSSPENGTAIMIEIPYEEGNERA